MLQEQSHNLDMASLDGMDQTSLLHVVVLEHDVWVLIDHFLDLVK